MLSSARVFWVLVGDAADDVAADRENIAVSMPPSRASVRWRRTGSSISNITVATSSAPLRDQRVVGRELVGDLRLAALLDCSISCTWCHMVS